jgi:DNA-binding beta-propeller fold protein YncE
MTRQWVRVAIGAAILVSVGTPGRVARADETASYRVDRNWPKPFPNRWVVGGLGGLCVDSKDHVFILNRQDVTAADLNAGRLAPPIIELDSAGNLVNSWGDPAQLDPRLHSCTFDKDDNIWVASAPSGMLQKYTHDGSRLLQQIGKKGALDSSDGTAKGKPLNSDAAVFFMPSSISIDRKNGDIYVSDGESPGGNQRVLVMDAAGRFLRQWRPEGMRTVHCMILANDATVYVCNRENSRLQLYDTSGAFLKNIDVPWRPYTSPADGKIVESGGSAVSVDISRDQGQRYLYIINQNNSQIEVTDRKSGTIVSHFGEMGHFPGQFDQPHGIAVDSKGAVYVTENRGRRVQRFVPQP